MLYLVVLSVLVCFLVVERRVHERRVRRIPIRIHVNGTRGKSTVVRLIASALRKGGMATLAKTTGTVPTLIHPDGHEEAIVRRGPARIQEQMQLIRRASKMGVDAIVVECMALDPALQAASEDRLIQSTVGVITNVRRDHFEAMGENLDEIASSLSQTIPNAGLLVTADRKYFGFFQAQAERKKTKVLRVGEHQEQEPPATGRSIFEENAELAKAVCSSLLLKGSTCRPELERTPLATFRYEAKGRTIFFVDAFSANDIDSTKMIEQATLQSGNFPRPYAALLNNRSDRPLRMRSFVSFLTGDPFYDLIVLAGDLKFMAKRALLRGLPELKVITLEKRTPDEVLEEICERASSHALTIFGIGNYRGMGDSLSQYFRERGEPWDSQSRSH